MLSQERLASQLSYPFQYFDSVDSTNDIAQDWLRNGADSLSLVIADEQRKGRGRRGRIWYTPPDVALAVSVILKPRAEYAARASMVGALAVYDMCHSLNIENIGIKWPNDVQINGKKISGILPEAVWNKDKLLGVVLGMGVNVRNELEGKLVHIATTLSHETTLELNRTDLVAYLMQRIAYWYNLIEKDDLHQAWKSRLNTLEQDVKVTGANLCIVGKGYRRLLIKTADGSIQTVLAGDVSLRPQTL